MKKRSRLTTMGLVITPLVFFLLILIMWLLKFFEFSGTEASSRIVATSLTLGGGLIATMVTLIGLILRQSIEQRNADLQELAENRLRMEEERNSALKEEAERRLKLDTAIRAIDLLGTNSGDDTNLTQRTGVLYTLAHLGLMDLCIDLVGLMFPNDLLSSEAATNLINMAFQSNNHILQRDAAGILREHSDLLVSDGGLTWPSAISFDWPQKLDYFARVYAIEGLMKVVISLPRDEWKKDCLNAIAAFFIIAYRDEQDNRIKREIALYLQEFLKIYEQGKELYLPNENINIDALLNKVNKDYGGTDVSDKMKLTFEELKEWMRKEVIDD